MIHIVREITKLCMLILFWVFPIWLASWNRNNLFLFFFILSALATVGVFSHYEELERTGNSQINNDESDE